MKGIVLAIKMLLLMSILTGIIYPLAITGLAQLLFPGKANGSLVYHGNQIIGSTLIGQKFDTNSYFWSRPSAVDYNPVPSSGSNMGPTSLKLKKLVEERTSLLKKSMSNTGAAGLPTEMIFASGSGLDPHISPEAAILQLDRVATARHFDDSQRIKLMNLINDLTEGRQFLFLGQPRINVFKLNLALDSIPQMTK